MPTFTAASITVAEHLLPALLNADLTGLSADDLNALNELNEFVGQGAVSIDDDNSHFDYCQFCKCHADCYELTITWFE